MSQLALQSGTDPADSTPCQDHDGQFQQQQQQYYHQQQQTPPPPPPPQQHYRQVHNRPLRVQPLQIHPQKNYGSLPASPSSPTLSTSSAARLSASSQPATSPALNSPLSFSSYPRSPAAESSPGSNRSAPNQYSPTSAARPLLQQTTTISTRSPRKQAPSPLQTSTEASSSAAGTPSGFTFPFPSPSPSSSSNNPSPRHSHHDRTGIPQIVTTGPESPRLVDGQQHRGVETTYFESDSGASTPNEEPLNHIPASPRQFTNDSRSVSDPVVTRKTVAGATITKRAVMAGSSKTARSEPAGLTRNASVDSAVSSLSNTSRSTRKNSSDSISTTHDLPSIIKAAGSAEAVIEHLLKEKQAQGQQNAQLWRLVDKQRAMIIGLNTDLERALKEKDRYRRKLKELTSDSSTSLSNGKPPAPAPSAPAGPTQQLLQREVRADSSSSSSSAPDSKAPAAQPSRIATTTITTTTQDRGIADDADASSHINFSDSPVDLTLAPYPITPPADQQVHAASAIDNLLNPVETMPRPQDHALDHFDHEAEERQADAERQAAAAAREHDLPISLSLPPSRSLPSKPPQGPPPQIPATSSTTAKDGTAQPSGSGPAAPPRKPPPAPLMLRDTRSAPQARPANDEALAASDDSDFDSLLEVNAIPETEKRGRRKTREEDDRERELLAFQVAAARSRSGKAKTGDVQPPSDALDDRDSGAAVIPESPASASSTDTADGAASSEDVISQQVLTVPQDTAGPMLSPGLPSNPRPGAMAAMRSPFYTSVMSPRMAIATGAAVLSPRFPRQPIALPPGTPLQTPESPVATKSASLSSPKATSITKLASDSSSQGAPSSPSIKSVNSREAPPERTQIYKGFVTEEYPDLLLPPNALPSVNIRVASSRMKPSRASLISLTQLEEDPVFTLAVISRADGGELWRVEKDTQSLSKLDQRLKQCSTFTARTPDRSLFSGHAPAKLDARRNALNHYLEEVMNTPLDSTTALDLCRYLSTHVLPPNSDETGSTNAEVRKEAKAKKTKINYRNRPVRNGYLTKRGKNFGGWKARFFVLDGPHLKYYETPGGAHLGTIKLQGAQIGKQSPSNDSAAPGQGGKDGSEDIDNQYRHAFLILEPKKKDPTAVTKHVLCAESDHERDQWVDALLCWIDYRDNDEEDDASSLTNTDRSSTASPAAKKKSGGSSKKQQHQKALQISSPQQPLHVSEGSEALIGVSYDAMQQGQAPQVVAGPHDAPQVMLSQPPSSSHGMSAPRDAPAAPDSNSNSGGGGSWGNRGLLGASLNPPSVDEKKARKRSFFGFATKVRASSDNHSDGLFGGDSSGGGAHGHGHGPGHGVVLHQVFGAPLADAVRYNAPADVNVPIPAVVYRCIQYLEANNAINEEGIFRLSGSNVVIKQLRERFNLEGDLNLITDSQYHDIHAVASLLKMYLRELPTTILTRELHMQFLAVTEMATLDEKLASLADLSTRLPPANEALLRYLIAFLVKIINNADQNKMTVRNVGIVFSPTLNIPAPVFALLLQNYEAIFGMNPEDHELFAASQQTRRPSQSSVSTAATSDLQPPRPPTARTSESPHRQRLLEAFKNGNSNSARNTQTPPPLLAGPSGLQFQSRSTSSPTPPPTTALQAPPVYPPMSQQQQQRMTTYEPQYLMQPPQGYDASQQAAAAAPVRANPGYDRPIYESPSSSLGLAPADQRNNRRESFMFGGNGGGANHAQQQGGKGHPGGGGRY